MVYKYRYWGLFSQALTLKSGVEARTTNAPSPWVRVRASAPLSLRALGPARPRAYALSEALGPRASAPQSLCAPGPPHLGSLALKGPRALEPLGPRP